MKILQRISFLLLVFLFVTDYVTAQRRRGTAAKVPSPAPVEQPAPAFENVLATDRYRIYAEIRGLGQLLKTPSFNDVIEPIMKVASTPKEFKTLLKWLDAESDSLTTSRMMVASWSAQPKLPNVLLAIEFASPEEAQKFEPRLKAFLPKVLPPPPPTSTPESSPRIGAQSGKKPADKLETEHKNETQPKESGPQFIVKQSGSLIFISDRAFTLKNLRPAGSKLLSQDPNFRRVHDRFATESVFVFVDIAGMERADEERRRKVEEEELKSSAQAEAAQALEESNEVRVDVTTNEPPEVIPPTPPDQLEPDVDPEGPARARQFEMLELTNEKSAPPPAPAVGVELLGKLSSVLFRGRTSWPDAMGVALAFDPDTYALRVLMLNENDAKQNPIPFLPQLIAGPPVTPEAATVFPSNTELFATVSLDYAQIYDGLVKAFAGPVAGQGTTPASAVAPGEQVSPFAEYEKKSGIKLKADLIPLLGNELAVMMPLQTLDIGPSPPVTPTRAALEPDGTNQPTKDPAPLQKPNLVIAISIRDREGVRALLPKVIDSFFKGASLLAQTEKRGDAEIISYGGALSYAFIGNFLLISPSAKDIRQVVDASLNHDTLASESHFRNFTRWQPRQVLGQFYLSPKLMESYRDAFRPMESSANDQMREFVSRLGPGSEPLTYALSNEGSGPLHELHLPKNLALVMLASMFGAGSDPTSPAANESIAQHMLRTVASAQATFRATNKDGSYGSMEQLVASGLIGKDAFGRHGYQLYLTVLGPRFEASAVPVEYGKSGKLSFFIDESNVLRAGDHGGGPATVADKPVN